LMEPYLECFGGQSKTQKIWSTVWYHFRLFVKGLGA
jgi:hypothetical protein